MGDEFVWLDRTTPVPQTLTASEHDRLLAAYLAETEQSVRPARKKNISTFSWIDDEGRAPDGGSPNPAGALYQVLQHLLSPTEVTIKPT
jgi:hypothetical protein